MISFRARVWAAVRAVARGGVWSTDGAVACTLAIFLGGLVGLPLGLFGAGCGGEPELAGGAPLFRGDLVAPEEQIVEERAALTVGGAPAPHVVYLVYADGTSVIKTAPNACHATAPKFRCSFGASLLDCQRQVQSYLDRWYADFNVIFTLTRPTSGSFHTVVVSSGGGSWCGVDPGVAGAAPFLCNALNTGAVYAFRGGEDVRQTAVIIAQEQAHLVGLEHTASDADLMSPTICESCDGFERVSEPIAGDRCGRKTQASYQMMIDRLGAWPGGPKPSAFGCQADSPPPIVRIVEPADRSSVDHNFSVRVETTGDCDVANVEVDVAPQILHASATAPPFKWDLSNITGPQTIVVTATDQRGRSTRRAIGVAASDGAAGDSEGCALGGRPGGGSMSSGVGLSLVSIVLLAGLVARRRLRS
jgi:hypothetical protein